MDERPLIPITKPELDDDEVSAAVSVIQSGWLTQGKQVQAFEGAFAKAAGALEAVATTSCTTALHLSLLGLGIQEGDEVIVPSYSFVATANAVVHAGGVPVFVDIDPMTFTIDPLLVEKAIGPRTRFVMMVHQIGLPCDIKAFERIAERYPLTIIEDAACALGSTYEGRPIGGHGNVACFSFHPRKIITTGEGGMITTDDPDLAEHLRRLRHHGMSLSDLARHESKNVLFEQYEYVGYNYRMTDIQAAIGLRQLKKLSKILGRRRALGKRYDEAFSASSAIRLPRLIEGAETNYQSYLLGMALESRVSRDDLMERLLSAGVATRRAVMAIHQEPAYLDSRQLIKLPATEAAVETSLFLPLYPSLTEDEQDYIIEKVLSAVA
jgi:dTDP-4-amino-4,6-dideoxygalactose transaminase